MQKNVKRATLQLFYRDPHLETIRQVHSNLIHSCSCNACCHNRCCFNADTSGNLPSDTSNINIFHCQRLHHRATHWLSRFIPRSSRRLPNLVASKRRFAKATQKDHSRSYRWRGNCDNKHIEQSYLHRSSRANLVMDQLAHPINSCRYLASRSLERRGDFQTVPLPTSGMDTQTLKTIRIFTHHRRVGIINLIWANSWSGILLGVPSRSGANLHLLSARFVLGDAHTFFRRCHFVRADIHDALTFTCKRVIHHEKKLHALRV